MTAWSTEHSEMLFFFPFFSICQIVCFEVEPVVFVHSSFSGKFGGDPGSPEHHRDQSASAHCAGGLSQPAHGERGGWGEGWGGRMRPKHTHSSCAATPHLPQNAAATDSQRRLCRARSKAPFLWRRRHLSLWIRAHCCGGVGGECVFLMLMGTWWSSLSGANVELFASGPHLPAFLTASIQHYHSVNLHLLLKTKLRSGESVSRVCVCVCTHCTGGSSLVNRSNSISCC